MWQLADCHGWRIVTLGLSNAWADMRLVCDTFKFIGLLRSAPAVLTDTFHGTIFSVLTGARIGVLGPVQKNQFRGLVDELDLADRVVESTAEMEAVFERQCAIDSRSGSFGARIDSSVAYLCGCLAALDHVTAPPFSVESFAV